MSNIHIYGLERGEAAKIRARIFSTLEEESEIYRKKIVVTIHERTDVEDAESNKRPYLAIEGDKAAESIDLAKKLRVLTIDIQIQPSLIGFYEADHCR